MISPNEPHRMNPPMPQSEPAERVKTRPKPLGPPSTTWTPTPITSFAVTQKSHSNRKASHVLWSASWPIAKVQGLLPK